MIHDPGSGLMFMMESESKKIRRELLIQREEMLHHIAVTSRAKIDEAELLSSKLRADVAGWNSLCSSLFAGAAAAKGAAVATLRERSDHLLTCIHEFSAEATRLAAVEKQRMLLDDGDRLAHSLRNAMWEAASRRQAQQLNDASLALQQERSELDQAWSRLADAATALSERAVTLSRREEVFAAAQRQASESSLSHSILRTDFAMRRLQCTSGWCGWTSDPEVSKQQSAERDSAPRVFVMVEGNAVDLSLLLSPDELQAAVGCEDPHVLSKLAPVMVIASPDSDGNISGGSTGARVIGVYKGFISPQPSDFSERTPIWIASFHAVDPQQFSGTVPLVDVPSRVAPPSICSISLFSTVVTAGGVAPTVTCQFPCRVLRLPRIVAVRTHMATPDDSVVPRIEMDCDDYGCSAPWITQWHLDLDDSTVVDGALLPVADRCNRILTVAFPLNPKMLTAAPVGVRVSIAGLSHPFSLPWCGTDVQRVNCAALADHSVNCNSLHVADTPDAISTRCSTAGSNPTDEHSCGRSTPEAQRDIIHNALHSNWITRCLSTGAVRVWSEDPASLQNDGDEGAYSYMLPSVVIPAPNRVCLWSPVDADIVCLVYTRCSVSERSLVLFSLDECAEIGVVPIPSAIAGKDGSSDAGTPLLPIRSLLSVDGTSHNPLSYIMCASAREVFCLLSREEWTLHCVYVAQSSDADVLSVAVKDDDRSLASVKLSGGGVVEIDIALRCDLCEGRAVSF